MVRTMLVVSMET